MADYGMRYRPDDNGAVVTLDNGRYLSALGGYDLSATSTSMALSKTMQNGAQPLIIPTKASHIFSGDNPASVIFLQSVNISGNTLNWSVSRKITNDKPFFHVAVFSVAPAQSSSGYGIRITNGSNFMEINDTSTLGFVTYRGTIDINGSWQIPESITSMGDYVVFANWNDANTPIYHNRDNNRIECYTGFGNANGSVVGGTVTGVRVVIVSCGFSPAAPSSGYGFVIRNAAGQITASSKYALVKWTGAVFNFSSWSNFDSGGGEKLSWTSVTGTLQGAPLVPLCCLGVQTGDFTRSDGGWRMRNALYSGMKMYNAQVTSARGAPGGGMYATGTYATAAQMGVSLPCLDTNDYF